MSDQLGWREAIIEVLKGDAEPKHYTAIADEILKRGLRETVGATPANTVNVFMSDSLNNEGESSPFERTSRGYYKLRANVALQNIPTSASAEFSIAATPTVETFSEESAESTGLINALGMYWQREKVRWDVSVPKLLGKQAAKSQPVDFSDQRGVYLLYDRNEVIYVGQAIMQGIGTRLKQHTTDRLGVRWDRFSWFGVFGVTEDGKLEESGSNYDRASLIATMEALLIESVEPRQNRRRGEDFSAVEFLQAEDPEIELMQFRVMFGQMQAKLGL